ncbi:MAG: D-alanine--D-alanine ligase [Bdellovibrionales bacterium GWC1_52_8]|nr:MAG: D-alanine--D-alanine ligase [Bdellovibrionales bacterium GWB1_52_6]OFZ03798.1 MAG: D-alanine--D-alanine ligase [Bdellovibrionales bacterium GWA1_52_35]OFZ38708.1 MAG: D-alanine--D-alanine ligase [Bdellovibrionales bacterium GWC1_52_8]HCM40208.1 D-alanine--D-alanine ligase [Bdellovibrionales bacterium]
MKIAFTHNVQLHPTEEEAEFDTPKTIESIRSALARLGHVVELVEVSGPASRTVARLEALNPDLIFNTAEGREGRFREAFYPGLFDQLGIPFTGSDAYTCAITLDKQLTKSIVAQYGVPVPKGYLVSSLDDLQRIEVTHPLFVKPNFEGSSKGISMDSVVRSKEELRTKVESLLKKYPAGLVVEEYVSGKDVTVPYLQKASPSTKGVLTPAEYVFSRPEKAEFEIYDFELKQLHSDSVDVKVPADISPEIFNSLVKYSQAVFKCLNVVDLARIDYRITPDGKIYFLEINALPSLEPGAGIYLSAAQSGLKTTESVLNTVLQSACERYNIVHKLTQKRSSSSKLRVGLSYNLKRYVPRDEHDNDKDAEFDSPTTIDAVASALASYGHEVIRLEATAELPSTIHHAHVDVVFNIAEGIRGRNREAHVPSLLELLDIPYTGSDPAALSITLDKGLAKRVVREAGFLTPKFFFMLTGKERIPREMSFPLIVKPLAEGSSKGVLGTSVARNEVELREKALQLIQKYGQAALIEEFLPGREFTVALLGERRPKVLPPMEIVFVSPKTDTPVYSFAHKLKSTPEIQYVAPAQIDAPLRTEIERVARGCFNALGCRDVARIDFRLDAQGRVQFMECNPLPGLTPDWSDLCLISNSAGMDYRTLIGEILAPAIRRYKQKQKREADVIL